MKEQFVQGDTVVWSPRGFNSDYWNGLSHEDRIKYYGRYGYGQERKRLFTFLCHHRPQLGHCVLIDMKDGSVLTMCHTDEFELASEDDC